MEARRFARLGFYTKSSAKRPIGARTVQRLRSDVDLRRLVRGTSSQLRGGRFHGHCTSASAMKQWTWTYAIKKQTEESEKKRPPNNKAGAASIACWPMRDARPEKFTAHYGIAAGLAKRFRCTAEHVEARRDGGKDVAPNIVAACLFCNATRHKPKHPVEAAKHASVLRSRMAKGRGHPPQVQAAFAQNAPPAGPS